MKTHNGSDYCLYICPTLEKINEKNKKKSYYYEKKKIDVNVFNMDMREVSYKIDYYSEKDFTELTKCVNAYIDKQNEDYGFYDSVEEVWKNNKMIEEYINSFKKMHLSTFVNNYTGPDFDVFITLNPCEKTLWTALTNDHLTDMDHMYDFYGVRFWYDKKVNPEKCYLTVQGKYYDLTKLANDYYKNEKEFNMKTHDLGIKDIADRLTIEGSYNECFDKMKYLIEALYKINYSEKPKTNEDGDGDEFQAEGEWASGW